MVWEVDEGVVMEMYILNVLMQRQYSIWVKLLVFY